MSIAFLLTTLIVVATPGTGVVYTLSAGLSQGRRASVAAAFGCTLGTVPHAAATLLGLAATLHTNAVAFQVLKYLGVAYLLYMAWATLRDRQSVAVPAGSGPRSSGRVISSAVLINLLNPKLTMFFVAFLPQFVAADDPRALPRMALLSGVFMLATFMVFAGYGAFAAAVRDQVIARPKVLAWIRRLFAGSFVGLSLKLALVNP
ncbi:LysE family translocator [Streptomyces sp. NEAU-Y11]|uniref:LysE family translocator n=1 Tax=Streptomyces cucumeris TaxID=2962890 RepID=UPI0020C8DB3F|nr:LysE family translocator [Streptomyces sp. NEAU-Y11]MCP9212204.1 LysE family translocator [Streptomyces sp. NEAU-Y11]